MARTKRPSTTADLIRSLAVILIPFVGNLTDKIGRRPCMIVGALGSGVMGYLYLYAVDTSNTRECPPRDAAPIEDTA